jgi:signal transduction histidine kinase
MLGVALISIWNAMHGRGPFAAFSLVGNVLSVHILLTVFALPLMLTAALMAERRRREETSRSTRRKLICAQEQQYHRIAQELHADVVGRLALMNLDVGELRADSNASENLPLARLYDQISDASEVSLRLSHEIHPFTVEYLGLGNALDKLCRETGAERGMTVNFSAENTSRSLPSDVSHRLFRVAKEALHNVIQHSHAKTVAVELRLSERRLLLRIADDGVGMHPQRSEGKGLTWMREQLFSLEGTFQITSAAGEGTVIEASVPISQGLS